MDTRWNIRTKPDSSTSFKSTSLPGQQTPPPPFITITHRCAYNNNDIVMVKIIARSDKNNDNSYRDLQL